MSDQLAEARQALTHWGLGHAKITLIAERENAVFRVEDGGRRVALRLHRPGYHGAGDIRSELVWIKALAEAGFPVPAPLATGDGDFLVEPEGSRLATLMTWVEGRPIGAGGLGFDDDIGDVCGLYASIGEMLATLHNLSDEFRAPPGFTRHVWDREALLGPDPRWGRYVDSDDLTDDEKVVIGAARDKADQALRDCEPRTDFGLIHADALRENVFFHGNDLILIDFDDSGFGFRLYDLAVAVSQSLECDDYEDLRDALVTGYRERRALSDEAEDRLPLFAMLRAFASLGWCRMRVASRQKRSDYKRRAVIAARRYLGWADQG